MAESGTFRDKQYAFAAHIRDPDRAPAPDGIEDRRMAIYRNLFFNNIYNLLGTFFPVLHKIHGDADWRRFVRGFLQQHRARTPYFLQLPEEFVAYLRDEFEPAGNDFPFLVELAHYEYAELALSVSDDEDELAGVDPNGDLLSAVPVKSALAWAYAYRFPVHRIAPGFLPVEAGERMTFLALYRDADDSVRFMELNAVTAALLEDIGQNQDELTGEELLRALARKIDYPDADALVAHGAAALREMRELGILTGTRSSF